MSTETSPAASGPVVRQAREEDLEEIVRLWLQLVEFHADREPALRMRTDADALENIRAYLRAGMDGPDSRLLVAEQAGNAGLAGFILAHIRAVSPVAMPSTCGLISDICVDEGCRRLGVGRELYRAVEAWLRQRGQTIVRLNAATANPVAQAFWRAMGGNDLMVVIKIDL